MEIPERKDPLKPVLPVTQPAKANDDNDEEAGESGNVKWRTYWEYFHAGSTCCTIFLVIFSNVLTQALFTGSDFWLQIW